MRDLFCIFTVLALISPALAEGEQQQALNKSEVVATASYVDGAYNALNNAKQDKLTSTNVVESGSGAMVTGVTANNGTVTVVRGEVQIPMGSETGATSHVTIWFQ